MEKHVFDVSFLEGGEIGQEMMRRRDARLPQYPRVSVRLRNHSHRPRAPHYNRYIANVGLAAASEQNT